MSGDSSDAAVVVAPTRLEALGLAVAAALPGKLHAIANHTRELTYEVPAAQLLEAAAVLRDGADLKFEDIVPEVAGVYPRVMREGQVDAGAWSCGMVAGLIHDIPTVKELVDRIMTEADALVRGRLASIVGPA